MADNNTNITAINITDDGLSLNIELSITIALALIIFPFKLTTTITASVMRNDQLRDIKNGISYWPEAL